MTVLSARLRVTARGPVEAAVTGEGPAVVLVHGIPGSWRQAVPLALDLAAAHTVVLPSRPGYGTTPLSTGCTPVEQAGAYAALLDTLGIERAAIIGISGGGPSALAFAQHHPDRATALVLCCAVAAHIIELPFGMKAMALLPLPARPLAALSRWRGRRELRNPVALGRRLRRELTADEHDRYLHDPTVREDLVGFLQSHLDAPPALAGLRNDVRQLARAAAAGPEPTDRVQLPTLVLHGADDSVVPLAHASDHAARIPGAVLDVYDAAGHAFLLTRRPETSARIAAFLDVARVGR